jgi:predicted transglutaminase-like cysteine proteinase
MNTKTYGKSSGRRFGLGLTALVVIAGTLAVGTPAMAGVHAPLGFQLMCLQSPQECKGGGSHSVQATSKTMATLRRVNSLVNSTIVPRNDRGADVWTASARIGDCEDYVLAKRHALIRAGLPASALRIAYVKTRSGEGHAILIVKTSRGDYVLDNLTHAIRPLSQTGYRILSVSGANPRNWS